FHSPLAKPDRSASMDTFTAPEPVAVGVQVPAYWPPERFRSTMTGSPLSNVTFTVLLVEGVPQSSNTCACTGIGQPTFRLKLSAMVGTISTCRLGLQPADRCFGSAAPAPARTISVTLTRLTDPSPNEKFTEAV